MRLSCANILVTPMEDDKKTDSARSVAGKSVGRYGLFYITLIAVVGVAASLFLENEKLAPVIGMLSIALAALINLLTSVAAEPEKESKPEFEVMQSLIEKLDKASEREPMKVEVDGDKVTVAKGDSVMTAKRDSN